MGIWSRIKSNRKVKNQTESMNFAEFTRWAESQSGEYNAMNLSAVYQCIDLISDTVSKLPFFVMNDYTKKHEDRQDLYNLLNLRPNFAMNGQTLKKLWVVNTLYTGNGYLLPVWQGSKVKKLLLLDSDNVEIMQTGRDNIMYEVTDPYTSEKRLYRYDEIAHIKAYSKDGIHGISPLSYARLTTNVGLEQEKFQESFYNNGGRPDGVLKTASDLSSRTQKIVKPDGSTAEISLKDAMRTAWKKAHNGATNRFEVAILDNGLEYQAIQQISPADMDFVNSKTVNVEDICRFFKVPPYKLGVGKQTYSNNEQASIEYITNAIIPLVTQIEQELTLKLLLDSEIENSLVVACNVEAELRGDTAARANWYQKMQQSGVYSVNEIRKIEGLPEVENGDVRVMGPNYVPIERLIAGDTAAQATPNPFTEEQVNE